LVAHFRDPARIEVPVVGINVRQNGLRAHGPDSGEAPNNRWENLDVLKPADQIKFVIASRADFDWAAAMIHKYGLDGRFLVLLSPAFGLVAPVDLANWLLGSGLHVRLQLQLHKYIWDPKARGV
jgi:7-carboxy-7-deazaguanine synthase